MAHSEKRASVLREFQLAVFTGGIYGATHTISGHPLDTIKTRMQIDPAYAKLNTFQTTKLLYKEAGLIGFFRGCLPPLWGSTCYRSIMMSTYEASYTYFEGNYDKSHFVNQEYGIFRPLVIVGAFNASIFRGIVENPIEYAKLQGQTGKPWILKDIYRGLHWQLIRTTALLIPIFTIVDNARRKTELMKTLPGAFGVTCFASGFSYLAAWPVETLKNLAQTATPHAGATLSERIAYLGGPMGLYRGVWPGTICGGFRNGCAMVGMVWAQKKATELGLRD